MKPYHPGEQWLYEPEVKAKLDAALERAQTEPLHEMDLDDLEIRMRERWLLDPKVQADLDAAIAWAEQNPPRETDLRELEEKLFGKPPADSD